MSIASRLLLVIFDEQGQYRKSLKRLLRLSANFSELQRTIFERSLLSLVSLDATFCTLCILDGDRS